LEWPPSKGRAGKRRGRNGKEEEGKGAKRGEGRGGREWKGK